MRKGLAAITAILVISLLCSALSYAEDEIVEPGIETAVVQNEAVQKAAEEEAARIAEEEAARIAEEEAARKAAEEEAARKAAEEEAARKAAEEEAARKAAEEEAARKAAEEEAARKAAEEEAARKAAEEEAARKAAEVPAVQFEEQKVVQEEKQQEVQPPEQPISAPQAATQQAAPANGSDDNTQSVEKTETDEQPKPEVQKDSQEGQTVPVAMGKLPFRMKAQLPQTLTAGAYYETSIEIETGAPIEELKMVLQSNDPRYVITSYSTVNEASQGIGMDQIVTEGDRKNDERIIRLQAVPGGSKLKIDHIIIFVLQDIQIENGQTLSAKVHFEMTQGGICYAGNDSWTIEPPASDDAGSEEEKTDTDDDAEKEIPQDDISGNEEEQDTGSGENMKDDGSDLAEEQEAQYDQMTEEPDLLIFMEEPEEEGIEEERKATIEGPEEIGQMQAAVGQPAGQEPETSLPEVVLSEENVEVTVEEKIEEETEEEDEDEMITVQLIEDEEEELSDGELEEEEDSYDDYFYDDGGYYDDWVTFSSYGEGTVIDTATPYVLVKSYSHKKTIRTGDAFGIEIELLNTSQKVSMDNVVVKVETSDALSLANGTNTLFINGITAGGTSTQKLNLLAAAECKEQTQKLTLTISFEYIEKNERKKGEATESITLPIVQKDRLEVKEPVYDEMQAGTEGVISVSYVNKGFTSLYNMEATLDLENADAVQHSVYAGNVESGKSGTLDFLVTPEMDGEYAGTVTLTYEDSAQKEVSVVIPLEFDVMTAYVQDDFYDDEMFQAEEYEEKAASMPWIWIIAGAAAIVFGSTILVILKKKKAKAEQDVDLEDWFRDTADPKDKGEK